MTDAEKRRIQLLQQTRALYSDRGNMPAVHPRYQSVYGDLYHMREQEGSRLRGGTFGIRMFISLMLFVLFVTADYQDAKYANADSAKIVHEIEREIDLNFLH